MSFEEAAQLLKDAEDLETKRMEMLLRHPADSERLARDQQSRRELAREKRERGRVLLDEGVPLLERGVALPARKRQRPPRPRQRPLRLNRPLDAERMYRECIAIEQGKRGAAPQSHRVLVNYASMLRFQGRGEEALPLIREAIRLRPRMLAAVRQAAEMLPPARARSTFDNPAPGSRGREPNPRPPAGALHPLPFRGRPPWREKTGCKTWRRTPEARPA